MLLVFTSYFYIQLKKRLIGREVERGERRYIERKEEEERREDAAEKWE